MNVFRPTLFKNEALDLCENSIHGNPLHWCPFKRENKRIMDSFMTCYSQVHYFL